LPKLAKLHSRGQIIFLMATNFQSSFDDAIKRAGRFDFMICMGPPTISSKCTMLHRFFDLDKPTAGTTSAGEALRGLTSADGWTEDQLSLFTYGEFESFLGEIGDADTIEKKLKSYKPDEFKDHVKRASQSVGLKMDDLEELRKVSGLKDWTRLVDLDRLVFTEQSIKPTVNPKLPAIKYVLDRKQTRRQYAQSARKLEPGK